MTINKKQLIECVIRPTCEAIGKHSQSSENLLLYTSACESNLGTYLKQMRPGPALGIWQHEPRTYYEDYDLYLDRPEYSGLKEKVLNICGYNDVPPIEALTYNLRYACAMARIHYARFPEELPSHDDFDALVRYYYKYWGPNPSKTSLGKAKRRITGILF